MMQSMWIFEIILFIYGLSLVFYTIDLKKNNWAAKKAATGLLGLAWLMQSFMIVFELIYMQRLSLLTLNEGIYIYGWILLTISLIMNRIFPVRFIVFFANLFAFCMFWLAISLHPEYQVLEKGIQLQHEILIAHIAFTILAYGFLTLSFLLAIMYLVQYRLLKKKKGFHWLWRLSNLSELDTYSFSFVKLGVPFLFLGLILGVVWGHFFINSFFWFIIKQIGCIMFLLFYYVYLFFKLVVTFLFLRIIIGVVLGRFSNKSFYWFDMKTIGSISVLLVYLVYLVLRWTRGYRGRSLSILNSATFLILLVNFFLFNTLSNFHF